MTFLALFFSTLAFAGSPDFLVSSTSLLPAGFSASAEPTDCRAHIKDIMCLVDPAVGDKPRVCLEGGLAYAHYFEELHDHFPAVLQKVFCSLDVIYIEKSFQGTAYAGTGPNGETAMGIRKTILDGGLDLKSWSTWKEQLSFGGNPDDYSTRADLPETLVSPVQGVDDFLYFVITHEFGHILDFANHLNLENCTVAGQKDCPMAAGSWGALSWASTTQPLAQFDFEHRAGLCFYWCKERGGALGVNLVPSVYDGLVDHSPFISAYATTEPWDDFADSLAYFLVNKNLGQSYVIDTKQGMRYDIMAKLHSPMFAAKYDFIEKFLQRGDVKYP